MRAPYQILAIPYRFKGDIVQFCIFHRSDSDVWQFVAGSGEMGETITDSAKREVLEETGVNADNIVMLKSISYLPVTVVKKNHRIHWDKNTYVIPECSFAFECNSDITISKEHDRYLWVPYEEAQKMLCYDSNKTALYELFCTIYYNKYFSGILGNSILDIKVKDYPIIITKVVDNINSVLEQKHNIKIKIKTISEWLLEKGFVESYTTRFGKKRKRITENGLAIGMFSRFHLVKNGEYGYSMFLYKKEAQQFIIDNLEQILSNQPEYSGIIKNRSKIIEAKIPEIEELNVKKIEHGDRNI